MKATTTNGNVSSMQDEAYEIEEDKEVKTKKPVGLQSMKPFDLDEDGRKKFLAQVEAEYQFASLGLDARIDKDLRRLKLYNNQMRGDEFVGEPLLFTHMNTWLASLYEDQLDKTWTSREDGDIDASENMANVSEYDAELMNKSELDYSLDWDALFYSYGLFDMIEFDLKKKCPAPSIIDPTGFLYDTLSASIDGNMLFRNGMRFLGWSMYMSEREVLENPLLGEEALKLLKEVDNKDTKKEEARQKRMEAMGGNVAHFDNNSMGDNNVYEILQWRTWWEGKKTITLLTPEAKEFLGGAVMPLDEDGKSISWFVGSKRFNPTPHSFRGTSLPDILEDKQRKKAVIVNDLINLARSHVYGSYGFDRSKIKNIADLKWGYDKYIAVDGDPRTAIAPITKDTGSLALIDNVLQYMDNSAQTASATPSLQQGVLSEQQRTLGELEMVANSSKTRYSLALKTFSAGDKEFWRLYYLSYKVNFKDGLGEKVVRINGSTRSFRKLNRKDIICKVDPDIKVSSRTLTEARKARQFVQFAKLLEFIVNDPDADKRANLKFAMELAGLDQDRIDVLMPPTSDEVIAREQNDMIAKEVTPPFLDNDNHRVHIRIHKEAVENKFKQNHILLHLAALKQIQKNPALDPSQMEAGMSEGQVAPAMRPSSTQLPMPTTNLSM